MLKSLEQKFSHSFRKTPVLRLDEVYDGCEKDALGFDEVFFFFLKKLGEKYFTNKNKNWARLKKK